MTCLESISFSSKTAFSLLSLPFSFFFFFFFHAFGITKSDFKHSSTLIARRLEEEFGDLEVLNYFVSSQQSFLPFLFCVPRELVLTSYDVNSLHSRLKFSACN